MLASNPLISQKQRISKKFLGFLKRTFKDLLDIGSELTLLKQEMSRRDFSDYLDEEFRGSRYLADTAITLHSWFSQLSDRVKSHLLKADSIQTLTNWSLAALRMLPKVGEEAVKSLLKLGAVTVKKIREVAGTTVKPKKPAPTVEVLETKLQESWNRLHSLEVALDEADSVSRDSLRVEIEVANKDFAYCAGKLGISVGEALRRVKGDIAVVSQQEIDQRVEAAIAQKKAEIEEVVTQTKAQAEKEVRAMNALKRQYAQENELLKSELQQVKEVLREKELLLQQVAELKEERDRLLAQLAAGTPQPEPPKKISEKEWAKFNARRKDTDLSVEEFDKLVLLPYGHTKGSQLTEAQAAEAWQKLEQHIERKNDPARGKGLSMSYAEARQYSQKMFGPDSDKAAQQAEVETLREYHPKRVELLNQMQKEARKYNLVLRDLVAEPFSFCVYSGDQKRILAKMSLSVLSNVLQSQQVIDGQLGRALPVASFSELMQTLEKAQHEQLELF